VKFERSSGVVLHPTALPGSDIGTLGAHAHAFVDFLASAGQRLWQVCPLGPTGYGNSPYQCFSAFAGNPLLIDIEWLERRGWIDPSAVSAACPPDPARVDFEAVSARKWPLLALAHAGFAQDADDAAREAMARFCRQNAYWLDDYALFMAIKGQFDQRAWDCWDQPARDREPDALDAYRSSLAREIELQKFAQYLFFEQWAALKRHAHRRGVQLIGDIPIFVALDSADVWAHRELFQLDRSGRPLAVAGVPPDYFSETGQLWGNPLYDWAYHAETGYAWWIDVIRSKLELYDMFRVDHFRGFAAYWRVPSGETTAVNGCWTPGPGAAFFEHVQRALGDLPLIAEDLGVITEDVVQLRDRFDFPGMKILQFAFDSAEENEFRPHTWPVNSVAYTGTHDNDTVVGWHEKARANDRAYAEAYLASDGKQIAWDFVRAVWASSSVLRLPHSRISWHSVVRPVSIRLGRSGAIGPGASRPIRSLQSSRRD
jgi:4-alpha-glucanotransferase